MRTLSLFMLLALLFNACQSGTDTEQTEDQTEKQSSKEAAAEKQYTITPFSPSPSYEEAAMESMDFQDGQFNFNISNYELGVQTPDADQKMCANSDKGQHIHLIVDTQPYAAKYQPQFEYEIADGEHYVLAFLSRSYHESIKNPSAYKAKKVTVEDNSFTSAEDITGPIMFYSRPKGTYVGKAQTEKILLDFYVLNAELGDQYTVKAEINGETHTFNEWKPYFIEGLPMGENTIKLTLLDSDGEPADVPLNPVTRTITLEADPAEELESES